MSFVAIAEYMIAKYGQGINQLPSPQSQELEEKAPESPRAPSEKEIERWMKKAPSFEEIAKQPVDTSLGVPISADRAQKWKDNLMRIYESVRQDINTSPLFKNIYKDMGNEEMVKLFNQLVYAYKTNIAKADLKHAFMYGIKYVAGFNDFRDKLSTHIKDKEKLYRLDYAIWSTQTKMWDKLKDVLNVHDMGFVALDMSPKEQAEMSKVLKSIPHGTWKYDGTNKNPIKPLSQKQRYEELKILHPEAVEFQERIKRKKESPSAMMRRLMKPPQR